MSKRILVTGATGNIGSELVQRLAKQEDIECRAFVRDESKAAPLKEAGAELSVGTFEDPRAVRAAVDGTDTLVLITAPNADAAAQASTVLSACKESGVERIVRISALKADVNGPTDNTRQHGRTDAEVQNSGLDYVILRPHFYMQNLFFAAQTIGSDATMYWGMGDGKLGMIDVRDVVDCAEACTLSNEFDNKIFTPTGPDTISFHDVATSLSEALGRTVTYVPVPVEAVEQSVKDMGMGDWFAGIMRDYSQAYSGTFGDFTTDDVERLTGNTPRSIHAFVREVFAPALG